MPVTKMIVVQSRKILPSDILMKLYEMGEDLMVKETCFGVLVTGDEETVKKVTSEIRKLDPYGIFIKERAFLPGEPYRCRARRGGGAKPGFHFLQEEEKMLPLIAAGLRALEKEEPEPYEPVKEEKISVDRLQEIIETEQ